MLTAMKLTAMAAEFANQLKDPTFNELGFEERLGLLVNAEWNRRQSNIQTNIWLYMLKTVLPKCWPDLPKRSKCLPGTELQSGFSVAHL